MYRSTWVRQLSRRKKTQKQETAGRSPARPAFFKLRVRKTFMDGPSFCFNEHKMREPGDVLEVEKNRLDRVRVLMAYNLVERPDFTEKRTV